MLKMLKTMTYSQLAALGCLHACVYDHKLLLHGSLLLAGFSYCMPEKKALEEVVKLELGMPYLLA